MYELCTIILFVAMKVILGQQRTAAWFFFMHETHKISGTFCPVLPFIKKNIEDKTTFFVSLTYQLSLENNHTTLLVNSC